MRILIAEDDLTSRTILTGLLRKLGHEVVVTVDGAEAWQIMQQPDAPKLAILDWMMPKMEGVEVCRRIRTMETDQPPYLIMLTAKEGKKDIVAGLDTGADDYLVKPYDKGELCARVSVGQRMTELQAKLLEVRNALAYEAMHDPLTGVLNRRAILNSLSRELSREQRQRNGFAIGLCDIDHFKRINDTYGHIVGDEVLCGFVRILESGLRKYDRLGRFGGEEFLVITPGIRENDLPMLYERLRDIVASHAIPTKAGNVFITISIGATIARGDEKVDELFAAADAALYQAKTGGRNRVCCTNLMNC
ncbi:MAG: diguanylate cyclase [Syntrophobacteraceae bacterium]